MVKEQLLSVREAADRRGITIARVHQLIQSGELLAEKYGNQYLIKQQDVDALTIHGKAGRPPKDKSNNSPPNNQ